MAFRGSFYNKQLFKSSDFRVTAKKFFFDEDGIVQGCEIARVGNDVNIAPGFFLIDGGLIEVVTVETINVSGQVDKTLCFQIDYTKENTEELFNQGSFIFIDGEPIQSENIYQVVLGVVTSSGFNTHIGLLNQGILDLVDTLADDVASLQGKVTILESRPTIYNGDTAPTESFGKEGDIFVEW